MRHTPDLAWLHQNEPEPVRFSWTHDVLPGVVVFTLIIAGMFIF